MPVYCYEAREGEGRCDRCRGGFEIRQSLDEPALTACPDCGAPVRRVVQPVNLGRSLSSLDDRAKAAGFTKLKRLGKGEYEKQY